jgi:hypothetical protein
MSYEKHSVQWVTAVVQASAFVRAEQSIFDAFIT